MPTNTGPAINRRGAVNPRRSAALKVQFEKRLRSGRVTAGPFPGYRFQSQAEFQTARDRWVALGSPPTTGTPNMFGNRRFLLTVVGYDDVGNSKMVGLYFTAFPTLDEILTEFDQLASDPRYPSTFDHVASVRYRIG